MKNNSFHYRFLFTSLCKRRRNSVEEYRKEPFRIEESEPTCCLQEYIFRFAEYSDAEYFAYWGGTESAMRMEVEN